MLALLTSCGRPDLLEKTLASLSSEDIKIIVHEDCDIHELAIQCYRIADTHPASILVEDIVMTCGLGQHGSIEKFIQEHQTHLHYLHLEDDWEFGITNWINNSLAIMYDDESIIKVLARDGSPHPCTHDRNIGPTKYGILEPWENEGIKWHGFSWNPGVTRLDLLKQFMPFPKWEQDLAEKIYNAGYRVAELAQPVYKHIGDGRSTH